MNEMIKFVTGDLLDKAENGDYDIIVHGCNCFCVMGSGIAAQIRERYPEAAEIDKQTLRGNLDVDSLVVILSGLWKSF